MSAARLLPRQRGQIHAIRKKIGLDDASYYGLLAGHGAASSNDLSEADAAAVIRQLRAIEGSAAEVGGGKVRPKPAKLSPSAGKVLAMWIALHNLGEVRDPSDTALHAFMTERCGIEHLRFLRAADDARPIIEALKAWQSRVGVVLPRDDDVPAMKCAILRAQWRRLVEFGAVTAPGPAEFEDGLAAHVSMKLYGNPHRVGSIDDAVLSTQQLDAAAKALGFWVRKAKAAWEASDAR